MLQDHVMMSSTYITTGQMKPNFRHSATEKKDDTATGH